MTTENLIKANAIADIQIRLFKMRQEGFIVPSMITEMIQNYRDELSSNPEAEAYADVMGQRGD